ncbi:Scr1 family TA system antitoxin-like transcriptional regulator [Streptomyces wedmorensis]|uniref:Scr1 family TA system antitoxin-like transcriptional regulator n=2 Tax=Streptomyces TaxID=1883 RepID=UPI0037988B88
MAKKMRQRKGLTQEQLGAQMGYTGAAVSALETLAQPVSDEMLVKLEQALVLSLYANHVVHGLFQTEEYARALIAGGYPEPTAERVEELVEMRVARKALFDRRPPCRIELVLDESVLAQR